MITGWDIYWIMQLDTIIGLLGTVCAVSLIIAMAIFFTAAREGSSDELRDAALKPFLWLLGIAAFFGLAASMVPSTKTAAMMYAIPAIVNNEELQDEAKEVYGLAKEGLKKLCEEEEK